MDNNNQYNPYGAPQQQNPYGAPPQQNPYQQNPYQQNPYPGQQYQPQQFPPQQGGSQPPKKSKTGMIIGIVAAAVAIIAIIVVIIVVSGKGKNKTPEQQNAGTSAVQEQQAPNATQPGTTAPAASPTGATTQDIIDAAENAISSFSPDGLKKYEMSHSVEILEAIYEFMDSEENAAQMDDDGVVTNLFLENDYDYLISSSDSDEWTLDTYFNELKEDSEKFERTGNSVTPFTFDTSDTFDFNGVYGTSDYDHMPDRLNKMNTIVNNVLSKYGESLTVTNVVEVMIGFGPETPVGMTNDDGTESYFSGDLELLIIETDKGAFLVAAD